MGGRYQMNYCQRLNGPNASELTRYACCKGLLVSITEYLEMRGLLRGHVRTQGRSAPGFILFTGQFAARNRNITRIENPSMLQNAFRISSDRSKPSIGQCVKQLIDEACGETNFWQFLVSDCMRVWVNAVYGAHRSIEEGWNEPAER